MNTTVPGLLDLEEATAYALSLRQAGQRLVVTNGCFDLMHAGHVSYLSSARALGDRLLVGLNSDKSTRALKGAGRPILPQEDRALILLALRSVDRVVVFDELTAGPLLLALQPPLYVKGGDYVVGTADKGTPLPEEPVVRSYGGEIQLLPYVAGRSTSSLLARIRAQQ